MKSTCPWYSSYHSATVFHQEFLDNGQRNAFYYQTTPLPLISTYLPPPSFNESLQCLLVFIPPEKCSVLLNQRENWKKMCLLCFQESSEGNDSAAEAKKFGSKHLMTLVHSSICTQMHLRLLTSSVLQPTFLCRQNEDSLIMLDCLFPYSFFTHLLTYLFCSLSCFNLVTLRVLSYAPKLATLVLKRQHITTVTFKWRSSK